MAQVVEWSANFSNDTLDELLRRTVRATDGVVSDLHRRAVMGLVTSMAVDETKSISFAIQVNGQTASLGLTVFMDDVDAPDVQIFAPPEIVNTIQAEHGALCDELGI